VPEHPTHGMHAFDVHCQLQALSSGLFTWRLLAEAEVPRFSCDAKSSCWYFGLQSPRKVKTLS
jgi:hypothetical protein